jgi:3-hydroxy-3-methylglutaryl CoA synthase
LFHGLPLYLSAGGRGVIDAIQSELGLTKEYVEPSRAALYRYGNVSSSSIWYVLSFVEHFRGVAPGDRVLQIAFGSGFKCNSAVWVANRRITEKSYTWEVSEGTERLGCYKTQSSRSEHACAIRRSFCVNRP